MNRCIPYLLTLLLALVVLPVRAESIGDSTRRWRRPNGLKTNLLAPVSLLYERALGDRFALRVSGRWLAGKRLVFEEAAFVNATVEGKFYIDRPDWSRVHPTGFYLNPYIKARSIRYSHDIGQGIGKPMARDEVSVQSIGGGLALGYQLVNRRGFVFDGFIGAGSQPAELSHVEHTMRYSTVTSDAGLDYLMIDIRLGISLGYAF